MFSDGFFQSFTAGISQSHPLQRHSPPGLNVCTEHVNCKEQTTTEGGESVPNFSSDPSIRVALYDVKQHKRQIEDLFLYSSCHRYCYFYHNYH